MTSIFDRDEFSRSLFFPRADDGRPPPGATDLFIERDGARLHVRCHAAPGARCTLLLFHGNGEIVADYDGAAARFAALGASLAVAEVRGYGQATGAPTLRAMIADARPLAAATPGAPLVVMGRSLGAGAAHELYARPIQRMVGVVLESAYFDLGGLVRRRGLVPPPAFTADDRAVFEPAGKLAAGTLPLLVLHGARDTLIDPTEAAAAHAAAASSRDRQLVLVEGRGHNDLAAAESYWRALGAFLDRVVLPG